MFITLFFLNVLFVCALFLVDSEIGNIENVDSREKRIGFLGMYAYVWLSGHGTCLR